MTKTEVEWNTQQLERAVERLPLPIKIRLVERLEDCRVVCLQARHWIPTEQPEAMREAIEGWCLGAQDSPYFLSL